MKNGEGGARHLRIPSVCAVSKSSGEHVVQYNRRLNNFFDGIIRIDVTDGVSAKSFPSNNFRRHYNVRHLWIPTNLIKWTILSLG
jgi:hypothetical protein